MRILLCSLLVYFTLLSTAEGFAAGAQVKHLGSRDYRLVFAHYMLCCSQFGFTPSISDYKREMAEAQALGLDGFVLNVGRWDRVYRQNAERMFAAALLNASSGRQFRLFFSADTSTGLSADDAASMVSEFSDSRVYLRIHEKPVLTTFGGTAEWAGRLATIERNKNRGGLFLISGYRSLSPLTARGSVETPSVDEARAEVDEIPTSNGFSYFGAAGDPDLISASSTIFGQLMSERHGIYMAPVSPYYFADKGSNVRLFDAEGFAGMAAEWRAAIAARATWVQIVTWNDWGESTYVSPNLVEGHHAGSSEPFDHGAYMMASEYYIAWFKSGNRPPRVDYDQLYYFYRPGDFLTLKDCAAQGSLLHAEAPHDFVYFESRLVAPARLTVLSSGRLEHFNLPAGAQSIKVPLEGTVGAVVLTRLGAVIGRLTLAPRQSRSGGCINLNYVAGSMAVQREVLPRPPRDGQRR